MPRDDLFAQPLLLDGATGTELERRGLQTKLPLWTALAARDVPELLLSVHQDYVHAGADILTACTFRTSRFTLSKSGLSDLAWPITQKAVHIARQATVGTSKKLLVAGSIGPLEDCYAPAKAPHDAILEREHETHANHLARAGVDLMLVESMPTAREALIATQAALRTGLPVITSLLARRHGLLFDHSPLRSVIAQLALLPIQLVSVNCCSLQACDEAIPYLSACGLPWGLYPNASDPDGSFGGTIKDLDRDLFRSAAQSWFHRGASMIGGCCGTRPMHLAVLDSLRHTLLTPQPSKPRA
ncbi:MAG TPA: homocysteine S-methyltransferase family protein [Polyangiaceae bacterium]|jgi:homocysteine S-methyltransferase|nr:MAG: Homocysteine S-methyltransferase [Deltaproteobacteria bacterium ADurb.Bin207]HNS96639.1 homocysteine S-methyltransferase family protein [Polyangiaceae bacterium]HNZ21023.1 homocysteine S-methyltransferase family protein [Polyangiaceae bacterium]HOD24440.1 homocysteine S-methyltransferase family protein [Polyangiaceae bacterium]HOE51201.1 homocysteine S-methyltransferase family protein [Polyangiaceae bacterium]